MGKKTIAMKKMKSLMIYEGKPQTHIRLSCSRKPGFGAPKWVYIYDLKCFIQSHTFDEPNSCSIFIFNIRGLPFVSSNFMAYSAGSAPYLIETRRYSNLV